MQNNRLFIESPLYISSVVMIAFTLFWHPVYRYGLFYLITFVVGYAFLYWLGRSSLLDWYAWVKKLLTERLDDFFLLCLAGVVVWWRLGHVLFYEWGYYSQHLSEIIQINQGGMSFVWGVCGVTLWIFRAIRKWKLEKEDLFVLWDIVLTIVPLGIMLWRYGNYLNQELWGKPVQEIGSQWADFFEKIYLTAVYETIDDQNRVNTNMIESLLEWAISLVVWWVIFCLTYLRKKRRPWILSGVFLCWYAVARFFVEYFKDLPQHELLWWFSVSQWMMIVFFCVWCVILYNRTFTVAE